MSDSLPLLRLMFVGFLLSLGVPSSGQDTVTQLGEFQVNTYRTADQQFNTVAGNDRGDFVVVWQSAGQDAGKDAIYGQRYNRAASPVGGEFKINTTASDHQESPSVAIAPDGRFVVTWQVRPDVGRSRVYARRFSALGVPQGGDFPVDPTTLDNQNSPQPAMDAQGNFVVVWRSDTGDGDSSGLFAKRYLADGTPAAGSIFQVNQTSAGAQAGHSIAMNAAGDFVAAWESPDANGTGIYARRFFANGTASDEALVNTNQNGNQTSATVAIRADGAFVVCWNDADADSTGIVAQRFTSSAVITADGASFPVNSYQTGDQSNASVIYQPDGGFVCAYRSFAFDNDNEAIAAQRFAADGSKVGAEFRVNTTSAGIQRLTPLRKGMCTDSDGNFVVTWYMNDGNGFGVFADKFYLPNQGPALTEFRVNSFTYGAQENAAVAMNGSGAAVVVWQGQGVAAQGRNIVFQRYAADGQRIGAETRANTALGADLLNPAVAISATGEFVIVWEAVDSTTGKDVYCRRFDANSQPAGPEFRVNTTTSSDQSLPAVAMDGLGRFVVVWSSTGQAGDTAGGIYFQQYQTGGLAVGGEVHVNQTTAYDETQPNIAINALGEFTITWRGADIGFPGGGGLGVFGRRYNADGSAKEGEFLVNTATAEDEEYSSVALLDDGRFAVAFQRETTLTGTDIFLQVFTSAGARNGTELQVNVGTSGQQYRPSLAMDSNGNIVVAWRSDTADGSGSGIVTRRFSANGTPLGLESLVNSFTNGDQRLASSGRAVASDSLGNYFIVWDSVNQDGSATGVYGTKVILSEPPTITTTDATNVAGTSATLNALIDANGQPSTVAFEYDTQSSFLSANVVQAGAFGGLNEETASVTVDGLLKSQTYYFRAKVTYGTMVKVANVAQFTTANAAPLANDDLVFVAGTQVTFQPQLNDSDPDQISASLKLIVADKTAKDAEGNLVGTLTLGSGDTTATFVGQGLLDTATFTYQAQDADGALSNEATVTLRAFAAVAGTYQGLVTASDGTTGTLTLVLNRVAGAFTGSFTWKGVTYPLDSAFPSTGVLRFALEGTTFELKVQIFEDGTITGVLFENDLQIADIDLDIIDGGSGGDPVASGSYTTFLDLPEETTTTTTAAAAASSVVRGVTGVQPIPGGAGYIVIKVKGSSKRPARFVGKLPDGEKLSYGAPGLSRKRRYTLVQSLYKTGKNQFAGSIVGRPQFIGGGGGSGAARAATSASALQGELIWNKEAVPSAVSFPQGFPPNLRLALFGLLFTASKEPIDFDQGINPNARVEFKNGGLDAETYVTMYVDKRNHASLVLDAVPAFSPKLKIVASNPVFSGSFLHPKTGAKSKFYGVLQQGGFGAETSGRGYFRTVDPDDPEGKREITGRVKLRKISN